MISLPNPAMPVTFTENYREIFSQATLNQIDFLESQSFYLGDMLEFIDEHSEEEFREYYEEYVRLGEEFGFYAVDYFIEENSISDLDYFERAFIGEFSRAADFGEEYFHEYASLDYRLIIDWEETVDFMVHNRDIVVHGNCYFHANW